MENYPVCELLAFMNLVVILLHGGAHLLELLEHNIKLNRLKIKTRHWVYRKSK
jgi:hypothetical protein